MIKRRIKTKVCIIGAGPSGASTSLFLAKLKIEHLIVDSASFPRTKICGDALDPISLRVLNHLDKNIVSGELFSNEHFLPSWGLRCIKPNGKHVDFTLKEESNNLIRQCPSFTSKRFHLDNFLISKIDSQFADFKQETSVTNIIKEGERWKVEAIDKQGELEIDCQLLVGADGDHSIMLKHLGLRKINREHYASSVRQYYKNIEGLHPDNLLEFYFLKEIPMCYFWIFPLPAGEFNVGFCVQSNFAAKQNINLKAVFDTVIKSDPAVCERFKNAVPIGGIDGWGLPLASANRKSYGNGWLLVGDAASMITPVNGEGIGNAMKCGLIASHFISMAIKKNDFSEKVFTNYSYEISKHLKREIAYYNLACKYPIISNWLMNKMVNDTFLHQKVIKNVLKDWVNTAYHKPIKINLEI